MNFKDIKQLTSAGSYQINMPLLFMEKTLDEWINDKEYFNLQLNPDFQRGHVWTEQQQVAYIEYLLKGGKSARVIYFNKPSWGSKAHVQDNYDDFVCVDGLQRLTACKKFMNNELKAFGVYLNEFEGKLPMDVDLLFNVNDLKTRKEVLQWYIEFNSGGTVHTDSFRKEIIWKIIILKF